MRAREGGAYTYLQQLITLAPKVLVAVLFVLQATWLASLHLWFPFAWL